MDAYKQSYVPAVAADKPRLLPEEAKSPPKLDTSPGRKDSTIDVLILAKKPRAAELALQQVRHRLTRNSTIVFVYNGMNALPLIQRFWEEGDRPNIVEGYSTHGLSKVSEFTADHWGKGNMYFAIVPRQGEQDVFALNALRNTSLPPAIEDPKDVRLKALEEPRFQSLAFILKKLLADKLLSCTVRPYKPDFCLMKLRRTIVHAVLQTLSALQRCSVGQVMRNRTNHKIVGRLLKELIPVLHRDPLIATSQGALKKFSFLELYSSIYHVSKTWDAGVNTLLDDIVGNRESDMGWHAGHLIYRARQLGMKMPIWNAIFDQLKATQRMEQMRYEEFVPMAESGVVKGLPSWMNSRTGYYWKRERVIRKARVRRPRRLDIMDDEDEDFEDETNPNEGPLAVEESDNEETVDEKSISKESAVEQGRSSAKI